MFNFDATSVGKTGHIRNNEHTDVCPKTTNTLEENFKAHSTLKRRLNPIPRDSAQLHNEASQRRNQAKLIFHERNRPPT